MHSVPLVGAAEKLVTRNLPFEKKEGETTQCPIPRFVRSGRLAGVAFLPIEGPAKVMSITLANSKARPQEKAFDDGISRASDGTTDTLEIIQGIPSTDRHSEELSS